MKYSHFIFCIVICIAVLYPPPTALAIEQKDVSATIKDVRFAPDENITGLIIENIEDASDSIDVAVFIFHYMPLADALIDAHKRGIEIRVLTDIRSRERMQSDTKVYDISVIQYLKENGVNVRVYDATDNSNAIMHNKFILIDEDITILGSFNFQKAAQKYNAENFNVVQSPQFTAIYRSEFNRLWDSKYTLSDVEVAEKIYNRTIIDDIIHALKSAVSFLTVTTLFVLLMVSVTINIILFLKTNDRTRCK